MTVAATVRLLFDRSEDTALARRALKIDSLSESLRRSLEERLA